MLANRKGIFLATIGDKGVAPTGPNNLTTFTALYHLNEELQGGQFVDVSSEGMTITGYHYIELKDGGLNQFTVDKLKEATGWDGRDVFWLEDALPADTVVKLELDFEEYNGKSTLKVKWLNHKDDAGGGGVVKADAAGRAALKSRMSGKLLAAAGGKPVNTPKPAAGSKPTLPPKAPAKAPAKQQEIVTSNDAWAEFTKGIKEGTDEAGVEKEWWRILGELFPNKDAEVFTSADWAVVREKAPGMFIPF